MRTSIYVSPKGTEIVLVTKSNFGNYSYFEYEPIFLKNDNEVKGQMRTLELGPSELRFELQGYKCIGGFYE